MSCVWPKGFTSLPGSPTRGISPILNCLRVARAKYSHTFVWDECSRPENPHKSGLSQRMGKLVVIDKARGLYRQTETVPNVKEIFKSIGLNI